MDTNEKKTIPVAYVTKWATTRGIIVVRNASISENGYCYARGISVAPREWTEDRAAAERLWREAVTKASMAARKKAEKLMTMALGTPKYETKAGA